MKISNSNLLKHYSAKDIICIQAESSYSILHLLENKKLLTSKTLKHWETMLSNQCMLRVHKSYTINMAYIKTVVKSNYTIELIDGKIIPVSRSLRKSVYSCLSNK
jgi:two-component system LytT family response regulator